MNEINVIPLTDIDTIMRWRGEVIEAVFGVSVSDPLVSQNHSYYRRHIADGSHFAVMATLGGVEAGCGGLCFYEELPSPDNPSGRCAYLMNIYVRPDYRHMGIGAAIVGKLVAEARDRMCGKIYLETTDAGEPLYHREGFREMKGMMGYSSDTIH